MAMKGTMIWETLAMRLMPPMITRAAARVTSTPATMVVTVMAAALSPWPMVKTTWLISGSKKFWAAEVMPFTWVMVPMPSRPAVAPRKAKVLASHFQFLPMPRSM